MKLPASISQSVQSSVVSNSLRHHESQHTRPPCPSPTPGVHSNSCPSSRWCHQAISSSVVPFSSCPQSLPASESFSMSQLFAWGGQSTGCTCKLFRLSYSSKRLLCVFWSRSDMNSVYHGQNRHLSPNWPEKAWTTSGSSHTLQHLMTKAELE